MGLQLGVDREVVVLLRGRCVCAWLGGSYWHVTVVLCNHGMTSLRGRLNAASRSHETTCDFTIGQHVQCSGER